MFCFTP